MGQRAGRNEIDARLRYLGNGFDGHVAGRLGFETTADQLRAAIAADPRLAGRLALWGRRLLGEMLSQAQTVAAEHDGLADLILNDSVSSQLDLIGLLERLTNAHVERMNALGLAA